MSGATARQRAAARVAALSGPPLVVALTCCLMPLALVLYVFVLHVSPTAGAFAHPAFWVVLAAFGVAEMTVLHIELGKNAYSVSLSEIPLTVGLFLVAPGALPIARLVGSSASWILRRRQRPLKLAFNSSAVLVEVAIATFVFRELGGGLSGHMSSALAPALVASLAGTTAMTIMVTGAIRLHSGEMEHHTVVNFLRSGSLSAVVNASAGVLAVAAISWDVVSTWLLLLIGGVLVFGYRGYNALRVRHQNLELLYEFTRKLGADAAGENVLEDVLRRIRQLLRAEVVELGLLTPGEDSTAICSRLSRDEPLSVTTRAMGAGDRPWLRAVSQDEAVLVPATTRDHSLRAYLAERGLRDCLLAPIHGDHGLRGVLLVGDRQLEVATFAPEDRLLLQTVAAHAATGIANSRLLEQLNHDSRHDALTGLANRAWFQQQLASALERDPDAQASVLLMDLDRFKEVNDTLGHHYGDLLLIEVARRLSLNARRGDLLARLGGDEFAVLMLGTPGEEALLAGERIQQSLATPMHLEGVAVEVAASLGIAVAPEHGTDAMTLMQRADVAMYSAKRAYTGVQLYDNSLDEYSPRRLAIASGLRHALESNQLSVHFQPQALAADGRVVAAEALVRWEHPVYGNVPPDDFIPIAEQTAQIRDLTRFVLRTAVAQCRRWADAGHPIAVSVNLSVRNLLEHDLPEVVSAVLAEHGVPASRLTLEITESHLMADPERTLGIITALAHMGVRLSVDDFGTGYSSLAYLKRLPVRELKIDKSFIRDIADGADDIAIVTSIVTLAQSLGLEVVAEGVEDRATWERLAELGCTLVQGYHLARPMRTDAFDEWLAAHCAAVPRQRPRVIA